METPNLLHKLAAQAHELGLPCVICESHFVKFTLCIFCQYLMLFCLFCVYFVLDFVLEINVNDR